MNNLKYKVFSYISLAVNGIYCLLNIWLSVSLRFGTLSCGILEIVFPLDYYTWHIYGIFALSTLIIKCIVAVKNRKSVKGLFIKDIILHFTLMFLSLISIYNVFLIMF